MSPKGTQSVQGNLVQVTPGLARWLVGKGMKVLATQPGNLNLIPSTYLVEGGNQPPQVIL